MASGIINIRLDSDSILIKNGRLINPKTNIDKVCDIYIEDGKISRIDDKINEMADEVIDASGLWVTPGFIDLHTHLREPGFEHKETLATGTRAGAAGGYTTLCAMPNTDPVCDSHIVTEYIKLKAEKEGVIEVLPIGAITKEQKGETLSEIGRMAKAGICALSEDGKTVMNSGLYKTAMSYAKMFELPIFAHCEDKTLSGGVMNKGMQAEIMGLKGISSESEDVIIARDIILAKAAGVHLHICHLSTKGGVELLRQAKAAGQSVSAEATPHHFSLSDEFITDYDTNTKMAPPLRSSADVEAIKAALKDGIIEVIATDHAPHAPEDKDCEYDNAAFGIVGLETAFSLGVTNLVNTKLLSPMDFIAKMTSNPAKILGKSKGSIEEGAPANIALSDPFEKYTVDTKSFYSKSKNSPFNGFELCGRVKYTIYKGKIVYRNGEIL